MNNPKNMLLIALFFLGFLLYAEWQNDYGPKPNPTPVENNSNSGLEDNTFLETSDIPQTVNNVEGDIPEMSSTPDVLNPQVTKKAKQTGNIVTVTTNVLKLEFDTVGASVVYAELLNYPLTKNSKENVVL
ncbi:MAG: membrane protein insertase YidC, partial [Marinicellaceae bacterium]